MAGEKRWRSNWGNDKLETALLDALIDAIERLDSRGEGMTLAEVSRRIHSMDPGLEGVRTALTSLGPRGASTDPIRVVWDALWGLRGRWRRGAKIDMVQRGNGKTPLWRVVRRAEQSTVVEGKYEP